LSSLYIFDRISKAEASYCRKTTRSYFGSQHTVLPFVSSAFPTSVPVCSNSCLLSDPSHYMILCHDFFLFSTANFEIMSNEPNSAEAPEATSAATVEGAATAASTSSWTLETTLRNFDTIPGRNFSWFKIFCPLLLIKTI